MRPVAPPVPEGIYDGLGAVCRGRSRFGQASEALPLVSSAACHARAEIPKIRDKRPELGDVPEERSVRIFNDANNPLGPADLCDLDQDKDQLVGAFEPCSIYGILDVGDAPRLGLRAQWSRVWNAEVPLALPGGERYLAGS